MQDIERFNNELWNRLLAHQGHKLSVAVYGDLDNPASVSLECEDCGEVVLDAELYTICARVKNQDELSEMPAKFADADITGAARSVGIDLAEIIRSLEDQAQDRDSSVDKDDPDCIFRHDAAALRAAVSLLRRLEAPQ